MVIIILGIIASVTLPKFVNFKSKAIKAQEDAVAAALNTALKIYNTSYIVAGGDPSSYPSVNPFTVLERAPKYGEFYAIGSADGVNWRYYDRPLYTAWYLYCPHWNGSLGNDATVGRRYIYIYAVNAQWPGKQAGDFWLEYQPDASH